jgi:hypothetical protein
MPYIVQQGGKARSKVFVFAGIYTPCPELVHRLTGKMRCTKRMCKTGMYGTGVNEIGKPHLLYTAQTLKPPMVDDLQQFRFRKLDKTVYRIVDNFYPYIHSDGKIKYLPAIMWY